MQFPMVSGGEFTRARRDRFFLSGLCAEESSQRSGWAGWKFRTMKDMEVYNGDSGAPVGPAGRSALEY
jgi:hypothetical protein